MKTRTDDTEAGGATPAAFADASTVIRLVTKPHRSSLGVSFGKIPAHMDADQGDLDEAAISTDLVGRIRAGDAAAEDALVRRYGERLRYVLLRQMAAYPHDLDDVIQETLTIAIERLRSEGIEEPSRLGGFIYGIAKNLRLAKLREHARHDGDANPDVIVTIPDDRIRPDQVVAGRETTRIVRRLLAELGETRGRERDREVLIRLYVRQQSREEVCRDLGIAPDHLRRVLHRAKQRLKALLVESMEPESLRGVTDE